MTRFGTKCSTVQGRPSLRREALAELSPERRVRGRNVSKADILVYRLDGTRIAVKEYGARPFLVRHTVGRWLVRRECLAYEAAGSAAGLAPFLGRLGPFALATEWIEATPLAGMAVAHAPDELFDRLEALIASLHARGVAVGDLHHRDVLVGAAGTVHIVDLAAACVLGPRPGPLRRRVFTRLCAQDRLAAARLRARFTGRSEAEVLARLDPSSLRLWRTARRIKSVWNWLRGDRA